MEIEITINNGDVQISDEVISSIVSIAIEEDDNFILAQENFMTKMFQKNEKVIKVESNENRELFITANVCAKYGIKIQDEAKKLQKSIIENVEVMTTLSVKEVNLCVVSIIKDTINAN